MLPVVSNERANTSRMAANEIHVENGSYWRLMDDTHELASLYWPIGERVLLVQEVRYADDEIHTIILAGHPEWTTHATFRILLDDFLTAFSEAHDGHDVRQRELAAMMGQVQQTSLNIAAPPEPALLEAKIAEAIARKEEGKSDIDTTHVKSSGSKDLVSNDHKVHVPEFLLPSKDIVAAQNALELRLIDTGVRSAIIKERTDKLQKEMGLVSKYHIQEAQRGLSSIAHITKKSSDLLKQVKTMRLFLGEDMATRALLVGKDAPADEPLTFMQKLLFLDEEIFVEKSLEHGFTADNMSDLSRILGSHPNLVQRMLPTPRCVVAVRIRKHERVYMEDIMKMELLEALDEIQQRAHDRLNDSRIFLLIRNGENVHLVMADEDTSGAQRLFPSESEINKIFTGSFGSDRVITPHSLNYTDAREKHDDRALFYKRFLIILWGVSERKGLMGPFIEPGVNWLSATVHSDRFRFVYDDEDHALLDDGRPTRTEFQKQANMALSAGAKVAVNWRLIIDSDSAPGMTQRGDSTKLAYSPVRSNELVTVFTSAGKLTANCEAEHVYSYEDKPTKNFKVALPLRSGGEGIFVLDRVKSADVRHYMESRRARSSYLHYLRSYGEAMHELLAREAEEAQFVRSNGLLDQGFTDRSLETALFMMRSAKNWRPLEGAGDIARITKIARVLDGVVAVPAEETVGAKELRVTNHGDIEVIFQTDQPRLFDFIDSPFAKVVTYTQSGAGKLKLKGENTCRIKLAIEDGNTQIATFDSEWIEKMTLLAKASHLRSILSEDDLDDMKDIMSTLTSANVSEMSKLIQQPISSDQADTLLAQIKDYTLNVSSRYVFRVTMKVTVGLALVNRDHQTFPSFHLLHFELDLLTLIWHSGHHDKVRRYLNGAYKDPAGAADDIVRLSKSKIGHGCSVSYSLVGGDRPLSEQIDLEPHLTIDTGRQETVRVSKEAVDADMDIPAAARIPLMLTGGNGWRGIDADDVQKVSQRCQVAMRGDVMALLAPLIRFTNA